MVIKIYSRGSKYPPYLYFKKIFTKWNIKFDIVNSIDDADLIFYPLWVSNKTIAHQLTNKLIVDNILDTKNRLCYTGDHCLNNKRELFDKFQQFYFIPRTFYQWQLLQPEKIYIVKPENEFARKGIYISYGKNIRQNDNKVMQEYITNPLLYQNKKFHFRIYVALIKQNGKPCQVYLYNNGFMYFAEKEFSLNDLDISRHFTGAKYCNVHPIIPNLEKYFPNSEQFWTQIRQIVYLTLVNEVNQYNNPNYLNQNGQAFHILGYDFLPDQNRQIHLLEINNGYVGMETSENNPKMCIGKPTQNLHNPLILELLFAGIVYKLIYQKQIIPNFTHII